MEHSLNRWAIAIGALGCAIGLFWVFIVGTAMSLYTDLTPGWNVGMYATCPVIRLIWVAWWLVPISNGALYFGLSTGITFAVRQRRTSSPFHKGKC